MENVVGYFEYSDNKKAHQASAEQEKILKLEKQIDYNNPQLVYSLYNKIIIGDVFHTLEGVLYLVHLQEYLMEHEREISGGIMSIPADDFIEIIENNTSETSANAASSAPAFEGKTQEQYEEERMAMLDKIRALELERSKMYKTMKIKQKKTDNLIYKIVIAALVLLVIIMLGIGIASGGPTILNYREQIQNEYSEWEQKLIEKEKELNERESNLN